MAMAQLNPGYHWDDEEGEFVDDPGQRVDRHKLLLLLLLLITFGKSQARKVTQQYIFGRITVDVWHAGMSEVIESLASSAAVMAFGGEAAAQEQAALIADLIAGQQVYLERFARQVAAGEIASGRGMLARAELYAQAAYSEYQQFRRQRMSENGAQWEKRILDEGAEHCQDCLAAGGFWAAAGELPEIGDSQCSVNCRCEMIYSTSNTEPIDDSEDE